MQPPTMFIGLGILTVVIGLPLADRRVPRNRWYGVRTCATLEDEHVWYEVNALAGRDLAALGLLVIGLAIALSALAAAAPQAYALCCVGVFVAGTVVVTVRSLRLARRLRRDRHDRPGAG
jgi:uncharacterized membrane protein